MKLRNQQVSLQQQAYQSSSSRASQSWIARVLLVAVFTVLAASVGLVSAQQSNVFNVLNYGARPNDSGEDTTGIQAAINAACPTRGSVYIPAGRYRSGSLQLCNGITVYGDPNYATVIEAKDNLMTMANGRVNPDYSLIAPRDMRQLTVSITNVTIRDLKLLGRSAAQWGGRPTPVGSTLSHGIVLAGTDNWLIERVWMEDFDGDGLYIGRADGTANIAENNIIRNCVIRRNIRSGVSITHGRNNLIQGCTIEENQQGTIPGHPKYSPAYSAGELNLEPNLGLTQQIAENNIIEGNIIRNGPFHGLTFSRPGSSLRGNIIRNNRFVDIKGYQLVAWVSGASGVLIEGNTFESTSGGRVRAHLTIYAADNICIRNNRFTGGMSNTYAVVLNTDAYRNAFVGNSFNLAGGSGDGQGIFLSNTTRDTYWFQNTLTNASLQNRSNVINSAPSGCQVSGTVPPPATATPLPPTPTPLPPTATPQPLVAGNDTATTAANTPVTINVLANDTAGVTIASFAQASHGTVSNSNQRLVYTPGAGFSGSDTFTYTIRDNGNRTQSATVTVTVTPPPPTLNAVTQCGSNGLDFLLTNSGGTMTAPQPYSLNGAVAGNIQLAAGQNMTVNAGWGAHTFSSGSLTTSGTCEQAVPPQLTALGQCGVNGVEFVINNAGGAMPAPQQFSVDSVPLGNIQLAAGQSTTIPGGWGTHTFTSGSLTATHTCTQQQPPAQPEPALTVVGQCAANGVEFVVTNNGGAMGAAQPYSINGTPSGNLQLAAGQNVVIPVSWGTHTFNSGYLTSQFTCNQQQQPVPPPPPTDTPQPPAPNPNPNPNPNPAPTQPPSAPAPQPPAAAPNTLQCAPGYQQINLNTDWRELSMRGPQEQAVSVSLPGNARDGSYLLVISRVGHPELGCPASGAPECSDQDNESFRIFLGSNQVGAVLDHGNNREQGFIFRLSLWSGTSTLTFRHMMQQGNNPWGSVTFIATYCFIP